MNILLLSMPDSFEHTAPVTMRMPNGALGSLAGNVDPHHTVAIADLVLVQRRVPETIEALVAAAPPDVVGLSIMTFQRHTARKVVALLRTLCPVDPHRRRAATTRRLATEIYEHPSWDVDAIVRGEGDVTFRELLRAWEAGQEPAAVAGLSYRTPAGFVRTPARPASRLSGDEVGCPGGRHGCSTTTRSSAGRSTWSRPRAGAPSIAASARSSRCAAATSTSGRSSG